MSSPWFVSGTVKNVKARWRLFCFPFAGGSGYEFREWGEWLPDVEVLGVFYPGRASRYMEPLIGNLEEMVASLEHELAGYVDKPFAFFGHSLGALIAFELTRRLRGAGADVPKLLCVSACDAPHLLPKPPIVHHLPDEEFIEAIKQFGGLPEAVLNHQELLAMTLPILRADIKMLETYKFQEQQPLNLPLFAAGGRDDTVIEQANLLAWEEHTTGQWTAEFFEGGHFYHRRQENGRLFTYLNRMVAQNMQTGTTQSIL